VKNWGGQYREELILNVTVFFVMIWEEQFIVELICCEKLGRAI